MRVLAALLLALLVLGSGCLGTGRTDEPEAGGEPLPWMTYFFMWEGPGDLGRLGEGNGTWDLPAGYGAQFLQAEVTLTTDAGSVALTVEAPDGTAYPLLSFMAEQAPATRSAWQILPATVGTWKLLVEANGGTKGSFNTTWAPAGEPLAAVAGTGPERVVVAVVDSGVNPYHVVYRSAGLATTELPARIVEAESGSAPLSVPVTVGADWRDSVRWDAARWAAIPARTLVHFSGTNVLGYHLDDLKLPDLPILDFGGHGTMVANSVTRENPEVLVVLVTGNDYDAGVEWAAAQAWVDMISLSWGPAFNALGAAEPQLSGFRTDAATRAAWDAGKLIFTASGNDPTPTFSDTTSGPPWAHAVAGSQPGTHARATMSGNFVDTVANWTQTLARSDSLDANRTGSGTSFATPTTAGIASRILHEVRAAVNATGGITDGALVSTPGLTVTNSDLRNVLNLSAVWWDTTSYGGPGDPGPSIPVLPAPWMSQGWGHLDGTAVEKAVGHLLGTHPLPAKPAAAQAWMDSMMGLREQWWALKG